MGSSGTIKACRLAIIELGFDDEISLAGMKKLKKYLTELGDAKKIALESVKPHRQGVFASGVAELYAIMKVLEIDKILYSDGALREGVMYDMLGRQDHEDVKNRSIQVLGERYSISQKQAELVATTAKRLFEGNAKALGLSVSDGDLLGYAARLHEVGLAVSHSSYHQHSAYLLKHSDLFGFTNSEQEKLAQLALYHRRKLKNESLAEVEQVGGRRLVLLCLLLRLSVLAHQSRSRHSAPITLNVVGNQWAVAVGEGNHAGLIVHQLYSDKTQFAKWGVELVVEA